MEYLSARRGVTAGGVVKGGVAVAAFGTAAAYGIGRWLDWQEQQNAKGDEADENQQNAIEGLSASVEQLVDQFEQGILMLLILLVLNKDPKVVV